MKRFLVLTTINPPNAILKQIADGAQRHRIPFIVIGDKKTPQDFSLLGSDFYDLAAQEQAFPDFARVLPVGHYARKNVGYLLAMQAGAEAIQETDDDNIPRAGFWADIPDAFAADAAVTSAPWVNVYRFYCAEHVWPRGFPLQHLDGARRDPVTFKPAKVRGLIIQGLADGNPDVDAVYRLTRPLPLTFNQRKPLWLAPGQWCPFNSQNTIFRREVFPLLYLPAHCSFRMTDIWRSFIAQRCLWELGEGVVFLSPTVEQERNDHNLLRDFEDEIPGYRWNDKIKTVLTGCRLTPGDVGGNLRRCYEALVESQIFPADELDLVESWIAEVNKIGQEKSR